MYLEAIKSEIKEALKAKFNLDVVLNEPKELKYGDLAVVLFPLTKALNKQLNEISEEVIATLKENKNISDFKLAGGFLNLFLNRTNFSLNVLNKTFTEGNDYPIFKKQDQTIAVDYSSPNIAKSFSIGHLRSTIIGNSLIQIAKKLGYNTVGINYLGDWGTQFGKMIVAYNKWLDQKALRENPILELTRLYVKFHDLAESDESLNDEARNAFLKCEQGDPVYLELWRQIRELSLKESQEIYDLLDINFDSYKGEAFYNDKMIPIIDELKAKGLLVLDDGAMVVKLDDMPPALVQRSDGGTLYITRDITAFIDRLKEYQFSKMLYVVGNEQKLHFKQLQAVLKKMGYNSDAIEHVNFGLYLTNGKKMSTRKGGVVKLYDVLMSAINLAEKEIESKNPTLENKKEVAKRVGIAAILFNDLKNQRDLNIDFNLANAVKFEGNTGPYLLYSCVRIKSILNSSDFPSVELNEEILNNDLYFEIIKLIDSYDQFITKSFSEFEPSIIAKYLLQVAQTFNHFYANVRIITEDKVTLKTNLLLIKALLQVLESGLHLLGIKTVAKM